MKLAKCPKSLVIVESPFAGRDGRTESENLLYLRRCLRDSWSRGEIPFASHGFFPLFLKESDPEERRLGILAGYEFWHYAEKIAFYVDFGMSRGMNQALSRLKDNSLSGGIPFEIRTIGPSAQGVSDHD